MRTEHILMIINPKSGSADKGSLVDAVRPHIKRRNWELKVFETTGDEDKTKILEEVERFKPSRIVIAGGDGTVNLVAHILKDHNIPMGILPSGSANGLASNLKIPDEVEAQIGIALGEHFYKMDQLIVNTRTCLHIADLGLNAELISNFESGNIRGKFGYLLQSIPTLINTESPFDFTITIKDKTIERSGILLAIANARQYGTGATINPGAKMDDGQFEVLIFKSFDVLAILKTLYDEPDLDSDFVECFTTDHAIIESKKPIPFQIDGELMESTDRVEASVYKSQLTIAVPRVKF